MLAKVPKAGSPFQGGMRPADVIKCATWNGALYLGMDHAIGSIETGKLADFVVLDRDIMSVPDRDILGTAVLATYIGGVAVYERR